MMLRQAPSWLPLGTLAVAIAMVALPEALPGQEAGDVDAAFEALGERWQLAAETLGVPGFAVLVLDGNEVRHRQVSGIRNAEGSPVERTTPFYVASITKSFVAAALLMAAEKGRLSLDDPVSKHLPRFVLADAGAAESIRVRDLMCHAPGLQCDPAVFLDAYTGQITEERYYRHLSTARPLGTPTYTNIHFTLAGRVLESVAGKPWQQVVREHVFAPLAMVGATSSADALYRSGDAAQPLRRTPSGFGPTRVRKTDATMHAAGGVAMSVNDIERWLRFQLGRGRVLEADGSHGERLLDEAAVTGSWDQHATLAQPMGGLPRRTGFGHGWIRGDFMGETVLEHGGGYEGAAAVVSIMPERGFALAFVANTGTAGSGMSQLVMIETYSALLGRKMRDLLPTIEATVAKMDEARGSSDDRSAELELSLPPARYTGTFAHADWGELEIRVEGGHLAARIGALSVPLRPDGQDGFRVDWGGDWSGRAGRFVVESGRCVAVECAIVREDPVRMARSSPHNPR